MESSKVLANVSLSHMQKKAVMKLAVNLAKSDKQIHGGEIALLNDYQSQLEMSESELEMIHYLSFQESIEVLSDLPSSVKETIINMFVRLVEVDVDVDVRERVLLTAIRMGLDDYSKGWTKIFSAFGVEAECSSDQIIYLEKRLCQDSRDVLNDDFNNLLLTKALNDVGLQLFYLPKVKKDLDVELLCRSMEYILPSGRAMNHNNLEEPLDKITPVSLFNAFCSMFRLSPGLVDYDAFLILKLQEGEILNDEGELVRSMDFICIDVSDKIKDRVSYFVSHLDAPVRVLSYDGYYRLLYDHLMSSSAVRSSVRINSKGDFYLAEAGNQKLCFESSPQSKTLYLLLLLYGVRGVPQTCFEAAQEYLESVRNEAADSMWDYESFMKSLSNDDSERALLIRRIISIYSHISTKDPVSEGFLNYIINIIRHRSTLKNYINNGFRSVGHLADKDKYMVQFSQELKSYFVSLDLSLFLIEDDYGNDAPLAQSHLWAILKS